MPTTRQKSSAKLESLRTAGPWTLAAFLVELASGGTPLRDVWQQVAFLLAETVERQIRRARNTGSSATPVGAAASGGAELADIEVERMVRQYFMAARKAFGPSDRLGFACDYSRVSRRPTCNGIVTNGNLAAWAPPQVVGA